MAGMLIGLAAGLLVVLWFVPCSRGGCVVGAGDGDGVAGDEVRGGKHAAAVEALTESLETTRRQMRNRLEMLDEMIEKADREIDAMQQRLAGVHAHRDARRKPLGKQRAMIDLLQAGGFSLEEIGDLTGRSVEELLVESSDDDDESLAA